MKSGIIHWVLLGGILLVIVGAFALFSLNFGNSQLNFNRTIGNILPSSSPYNETSLKQTSSPVVVSSPVSSASLIKITPAPKTPSCPKYTDAQALREFIFCAFGFRDEIAQRIRSSTTVEVENMNSTNGGGFWYGDSRKVFLYTAQREAALHELSHAFWEDKRGSETRRLNLVKDLIKLATLSKSTNEEYINAINFANEYVYGKGSWKGMFCSPDGNTCVSKNPQDLTDSEIIDYTNRWVINDHEIYAGFSSWTMGRLRSGPHRLPDFMAKHFDEEFVGSISEVPYFESGPL